MMEFITIVFLLSIIFLLIGIIIGFMLKPKVQVNVNKEPSSSSNEIPQEIIPRDPFPITTALDQKNDMDIKRNIRNTATPLFLNSTGGLHATKVRGEGVWLRN